MLIFGPYSVITPETISQMRNFRFMNFTSEAQGFDLLRINIPVMQFSYGKEFDQSFANSIMSNESQFIEFMKIVYNLYIGKDVYVLISYDYNCDSIAESLSKLIQQRYGYNSQYIQEFDDIDFFDDSEFSINGLYNFDKDKDRFLSLLKKYNIDISKL